MATALERDCCPFPHLYSKVCESCTQMMRKAWERNRFRAFTTLPMQSFLRPERVWASRPFVPLCKTAINGCCWPSSSHEQLLCIINMLLKCTYIYIYIIAYIYIYMGARCTFLAPPPPPPWYGPPPYPAPYPTVLAATVVVLVLVLPSTSTTWYYYYVVLRSTT